MSEAIVTSRTSLRQLPYHALLGDCSASVAAGRIPRRREFLPPTPFTEVTWWFVISSNSPLHRRSLRNGKHTPRGNCANTTSGKHSEARPPHSGFPPSYQNRVVTISSPQMPHSIALTPTFIFLTPIPPITWNFPP